MISRSSLKGDISGGVTAGVTNLGGELSRRLRRANAMISELEG